MAVWKHSDDINTDKLFPRKYTDACSQPEELKPLFRSLEKEVEHICQGKPDQPQLGERAIAVVQWVDGKVFNAMEQVLPDRDKTNP